MWNKLKIFTKKISKYNTDFMLDSKLKYIINLNYNNKTLLPFELINYKNLFTYELEYNSSNISIYLLINISNLYRYIDCKIKIPYKNKLFRILRQSIKYNNCNNNLKFKYIDVNHLLKMTNIIRYTPRNNLIIDNIVFNLNEKIIDKSSYKYFNMLITDLFFYYGSFEDIVLSGKKICLISDDKKYTFKININNYRDKIWNKDSDFIVIDSIFFYNKLFTNSELFNQLKKYNIVILNPNFKMLNKYLLKDIKTRKTIIFNNISSDIISKIRIYIEHYYEIELKNIQLNVCYMNNIHYKFYNKIQTLSNFKTKNFNIEQSITLSIDDNLYEESICTINYAKINDNSHYVFDCGHKFMIDNIKLFTKQYRKCPCCQINITDIIYKIHSKTILEDLLGKEFALNYSKYTNHYIINYNDNQVKHCIKIFYDNIYFVKKLSSIKTDSCVYIMNYREDTISLLNCIFNIKTAVNIKNLLCLNI